MNKSNRRVSVLPFLNSADRSWDYLAEGMTELCMKALADISDIDIVQSGKVLEGASYDEIAKAIEILNVDLVVIGEVEVNDQLRLQLYAYEGGVQRPTWSNTLVADLKQILNFGEQLKDFIRSKFMASDPPTHKRITDKLLPLNKEAYRTYLLGNYYLNKWDPGYILLAHAQYEKVIELEPDFVPAYLGLAKSTVFKVSWGAVEGNLAYPHMLEMLDRMILINPAFGDLYIHKGIIQYFHLLDWESAFFNIEKGLPLAVDKVEGYTQLYLFYYGMREYDKAMEALHVAMEYDPLSIGLINMKGDLFITMERFELAEQVFKELLELQPGDKRTIENLMYVSALLKDVDKTRRYLYLLNKDEQASYFDYSRQSVAFSLLGKSKELEQMLEEFLLGIKDGAGINYYGRIALIYALKKEWGKVMDCLEKSIAGRAGVIFVLTEPIFKPVWNWERFKALSKDIKLPKNVGQESKVTIRTELKTSIDLNPTSLLYAKSEENYTTVFVYNNFRIEEVLLRISLKSLIGQLPKEMFFHCHRSYIVNRELHLKAFGNSRGYTLKSLEHGFEVPVSRPKIDEMRKSLF